MKSEKIAVLGSGSFGTVMAHMLALKNLNVMLWGREKEVIAEINEKKTNKGYVEGVLVPFAATADVGLALKNATAVLFALPCQALREFLHDTKSLLPANAVLINLAKGIELKQLKLGYAVFTDVLGSAVKDRYAVISGPTFAQELYQNMPSGAAVASKSEKIAGHVQQLLSTRFFRLYTVSDLIGVEVGGALKNVMAICVGIADGLGYGLNTRAGLITRCLHEMTALGLALGARERTFSGLSGVGDLILTCTGDLSRNRQVGLRLGRGEKLKTILSSLGHIAEGVPTAKAVFELNKKYNVPMPNSEHVYKILYEDLNPKEAVQSILSRTLKAEFG